MYVVEFGFMFFHESETASFKYFRESFRLYFETAETDDFFQGTFNIICQFLIF